MLYQDLRYQLRLKLTSAGYEQLGAEALVSSCQRATRFSHLLLMKYFLSKLPVLTFALALLATRPVSVVAQTAERRTSIGLNGSVLQYQGDLGSDYWKFNNSQYAPGLAINQYLTRGLDLHTQLFYGQLKGQQSALTYFATTLVNANLGFKFKLNNGWALKEKAIIQPYLLAASGWTFASQAGLADGSRIDEEKSYVDVLAGAGFSLRLGGGLSLFVQSSQHLPLHANLDGVSPTSPPRWADRFLQHTAGLTINLGQAPDADEDGVPDRLDRCAHTPSDLEVDEYGCPLDDDKDGVPNYQDQCPSIAGTAEMRGCPDTDNDGVDNVDDACPDMPGSPELHGCPDNDKDGVSDQDDKCPDTPADAKVDASGCSLAPVAPPVAAPTIDDNDSDGVPNAEDRCPDHAGPAANRGCPEIQAETRRRLQEATAFIGFERNKAILLPSSYPTLDTIARILTQYPDYSLSIAGHTDSQGPAAYNLRLSRERAATARRYLLAKGLTDSRVELRGYGAGHPLVTNSTEAGRARNRRVEFDLFLSGDPNAAQVKYGIEPTISAARPAVKRKAALTKTKKKKKPTRKVRSRKAPLAW
jgi:outer membrane protein OmpA-like peptidoglycan-associated protein